MNNKDNHSSRDIIRKITIPYKIDSDLSELIGILIGDGHLYISSKIEKGMRRNRYELSIHGHSIDDSDYFRYINQIFKKLFSIRLNIRKISNKNAIVATINSKAILLFFKSLRLPMGNKNKKAYVPSIIKNSTISNRCSFIRGIADTDFSLTFKRRKKTKHSYPVMRGVFKSKLLVDDLLLILASIGLNATTNVERSYDLRFEKEIVLYAIYIRGRTNLNIWLNKIGFNNPKHLSKYNIWKRYGFCPPNTDLIERNNILKGLKHPIEFYN